MFRTLAIENIQSHKKSLLQFHEGVNIIIGDSDQGKSAIFNSLFWCMFNRPLGVVHRSWWGGSMLSSIELDNGIIELKRKGQSVYHIIHGKVNREYKAFGQEPPDEIKELFNIDRKINIQRQLEREAPIFLISEAPGDVARFFNRVAGIDKIDLLLKKANSELTKTNRKHDIIEESIEDKEEELKEYEGISILQKKVEQGIELDTELEEMNTEIFHLDQTFERIKSINDSIKELKPKLKLYKKINKAEALLSEKNRILDSIVHLEGSIEDIVVLSLLIEDNKNKLKLLPKVKKALSLTKKLKQLKQIKRQKELAFNRLISLNDKIKYLSTNLNKTAKLLADNMPDTCPLCGK